MAQRKETKETSTLPNLPYMGGLTAPTRRSFTKVSSPHQRGGLFFVGLRQCPCASFLAHNCLPIRLCLILRIPVSTDLLDFTDNQPCWLIISVTSVISV